MKTQQRCDERSEVGEEKMYADTHKIAQAEYAIFVARVNTPPREGYTVKVPNIIDRAVAALMRLFTQHTAAQPAKARVAQGSPAK